MARTRKEAMAIADDYEHIEHEDTRALGELAAPAQQQQHATTDSSQPQPAHGPPFDLTARVMLVGFISSVLILVFGMAMAPESGAMDSRAARPQPPQQPTITVATATLCAGPDGSGAQWAPSVGVVYPHMWKPAGSPHNNQPRFNDRTISVIVPAGQVFVGFQDVWPTGGSWVIYGPAVQNFPPAWGHNGLSSFGVAYAYPRGSTPQRFQTVVSTATSWLHQTTGLPVGMGSIASVAEVAKAKAAAKRK